jgi:Predicted phosphohydrolase
MPRIYAIADLHLSHSVPDKAMDVFGSLWTDHVSRLREAWKRTVTDEDLVLLPGDISWAMALPDAEEDFFFLGNLPGKKLLLRGNHDFWWSSITRVRSVLPENTFALQNDSFLFHNVEIAGTRGWIIPESTGFKETEDRKIFEREKQRLNLSLKSLSPDTVHIAMFHFPPFSEKGSPSDLVTLMAPYDIKVCVYGHLHGTKAHAMAFQGLYGNTVYSLVSADALQFVPKCIWTVSE